MSTIETAGRDVWTDVSPDRETWRRLWRRRWDAILGRLNELGSIPHRASERPDETNDVEKFDAEVVALRQRWRTIAGDRDRVENSATSAVEIWSRASSEGVVIRREQAGAIRRMALPPTELSVGDWRRSVFWFAGGLVIVTLIALTAARTGLGNLPGRYPGQFLTLASIVWWFLCEPREFAVLIAVIGILLWILKRREHARKLSTDFTLTLDATPAT
ncbi:MAG: hypothetical protein QM811_14330 [Pirellulales bacterium]